MYLKHYGLSREPFGVTPDPDFIFLTPFHKEALGSIIYGIIKRKGFVAVTGEVGVGKTTVIRAALKKLNPDRERPIYIFNSNLSFKELLRTMLHELGVEPVKGGTDAMIRQLQGILIDEYAAKRNVFLIIDEAQNMPVRTLENLRMLSNLETTKDKLLQIVLVGQPELDRKLDLYELRQLKQRIAVRAKIEGLSEQQSLEYIQHRLVRADAPRVWLFTERAKQRIIEVAKGNPRLLNILCDNALVTGFGYQKSMVTSNMVEEVIADLRLTEMESPAPAPAGETRAPSTLAASVADEKPQNLALETLKMLAKTLQERQERASSADDKTQTNVKEVRFGRTATGEGGMSSLGHRGPTSR